MGLFRVIVLLSVCFVLISCPGPTSSTDNPHKQEHIPWPSLANSPWPMFNHDPQNTGRSENVGPDENAELLFEWMPDLQLQSSVAIDDSNQIFLNTVLDPGGIHIKKLTSDCSIMWNSIVGSGVFSYTTPTLASDNILYTSSNEGHLWAINTSDGEIFWSTDLTEDIYSKNIILDLDGNIFISTVDRMVSLNSQGDIRWFREINNLNQAGSISPDGTTLYYGDSDHLYAISSEDGEILYSRTAGFVSAPTIGNDGNLFFQNYLDTSVTCLSPSLEIIWQYHIGRNGGNTVSMESGTLDYLGNYYTTASGRIWSFTYTGELRWQISSSGFVQGAALICDLNNDLYIAGNITSGNGSTRIFSITSDGDLRWEITNPGLTLFFEVPALNTIGQIALPTIGSRSRTLMIIG